MVTDAAHTLAAALDPVRLAQLAGVEPDPWQRRLLRSDARQLLLLCSRQAGKSTVAGLIALHTALFRAPALVLCLSPSLRQSQELFRRIHTPYRSLGLAGPGLVEESALSLAFTNGSRVVCLPGRESTVRGYSGAALLLVDEAARVEDELYQAVRPMLAVSGGRLVLLSTPFGKRGFFWEEWHQGAGWERTRIPASSVPRIPKEWLERERQAIGEFWYSQEYDCTFIDSVTQAFATDDVLRAVSGDVAPLFARPVLEVAA